MTCPICGRPRVSAWQWDFADATCPDPRCGDGRSRGVRRRELGAAVSAPVVFLDFDGVLVTIWDMAAAERHCTGSGRIALGWAIFRCTAVRERVQRLQRICGATSAEVVVSSTWRKSDKLAVLSGYLSGAGLTARVVGVTPVHDLPHEHRGTEIAAYLRAHFADRYVVLDDDFDAGIGHKTHFVQTATLKGLTDEDADRAIAILRGEG